MNEPKTRSPKTITELEFHLANALKQLREHNSTKPLEGLLRLPDVMALVPLDKVTWRQGCKSGIYPAPIKIGKRAIAWKRADIEKFLQGGV